jgi:hypothetical protein
MRRVLLCRNALCFVNRPPPLPLRSGTAFRVPFLVRSPVGRPLVMPSPEATAAYPGYAKARKRREADARRFKPGVSPILRAFAFVARVVFAVTLLPLDLLFGNAVRLRDFTRPVLGVVGLTTGYFAFQGAEWAMGVRHSAMGFRHNQNAKRDDGVFGKHKKGSFLRPRVPASFDLCALRGIPGSASACAFANVVETVVEATQVHVHDDTRDDTGTTSQSSDTVNTGHTAKHEMDVVDLADGSRALRVNEKVVCAVDVSAGVVTYPPASNYVVDQALRWQPTFAIGQRSVRVFLAGGTGGNAAAFAALKTKCARRSSQRHRRGENGGSGSSHCVVTLMEGNSEVVDVLQRGFGGGIARYGGVGGVNAEYGEKNTEGKRNVFRIVRGDYAEFLKRTPAGSLDVVVFDDLIVAGGESESTYAKETRTEALLTDTRTALRAGGVVLSIAVAPRFGPGKGRSDLKELRDAMRIVFGTEKYLSSKKTKAVTAKTTGPPLPLFPQQHVVVGTKLVDKKLAAHYNYN